MAEDKKRKVRRVSTSLPPEQKRHMRAGAAVGAPAGAAAVLGTQAVVEGARNAKVAPQPKPVFMLPGEPMVRRVAQGGRKVKAAAKAVPKGKAAATVGLAVTGAAAARHATTRGRTYRDWYT